ncbi:Commissureless [Cinara cedri]|uniref:Commissureless n=1 Tax=Cinara cedri TaxID=506608 RepID=A0A5E4NQR2_9HEMI|nr:Commissureless [Cinara cedri]
MDLSPMGSTAAAVTTAATIREGQRNSTHRVVNAHGRLMYDEIVLNDVWINAILSTLALSCATCVCLCFLYCKFQQWKLSAQERRKKKNLRKNDDDSLPSYTIVTGLPSYEEALERMNSMSASTSASTSVEDGRPENEEGAAAAAAISVVRVKNEVAPLAKSATARAAVAADDPKYGLVSHSLIVHDNGCSHCLSVQELLETYDVR